MSVGGTIAAACALGLLLALFFGWLARRSFKKFEREAELNAPLINSEDRRLDAALRDAEEGYNKCAVFDFENFKRFRFCTICGEEIVETEGDGDQQGRGTTNKKKMLSISSIFKREKHVKLTSSTSTVIHSKPASRRSVRAQRRKEWMRKLDVEGRAYWFRDSRFVKTDVVPAAFVVSFEAASTVPNLLGQSSEFQDNMASSSEVAPPKDKTQSLPVPADSSNESDFSSPNAAEPDPEVEHSSSSVPRRSTFGSVERCMANLKNSVQELKSVLIPVSDERVDALKLPLSIPIAPVCHTPFTAPVSLAESMSLASKDFPSKYAHFVMTASSLLVPAER
ncbi:hypothetical protein V7S43_006400 [Phytophthora oleae]|uniref:Uncharacterized protein n=1 Tax=Phytophthora oleae TaxID=2107226 RepID=A0ABD3FPH5_9STRA